jgi:hypothetical protein
MEIRSFCLWSTLAALALPMALGTLMNGAELAVVSFKVP